MMSWAPLKRCLPIAIGTLILLRGLAWGQGLEGLRLDWVAPAGCPNGSDVVALVEQHLGNSRASSSRINLTVQAEVTHAENERWGATVVTRLGSESGRRAFHAESCQAVAGATALIIALLIDPDAVAAQRRTQSNAAPLAPPPAAKQSTVAPPVTPARPPENDPAPPRPASLALPPTAKQSTVVPPVTLARTPENDLAVRRPASNTTARSLAWFVGPTMAVDWGTLPSSALGAGVRLGLRDSAWSLELGILDFWRSRAELQVTAGAMGGTFNLVSAFLAACRVLPIAGLEWGACAIAEYDHMRARGYGVDNPYGNSADFLAVGAAVSARYQIGRRFSVPIFLGALAPLAHPTFVLNGVSQDQVKVHRPSDVSGRALLGIELGL
jgi:hypothetical protein